MASTPAAMAAAIGSRDGSGPINGTGAGPDAGLFALATVAFALAAASFAAEVRSPLVSASFGAAGVFLAGAFLAGAFFAAFFAGAFFAALAGAFLAGVFLAGAFFALPWPVASSPGAVARLTAGRDVQLPGDSPGVAGVGPTQSPAGARAAAWTAALHLVGPAGLPSAAPLQCLVSAYPA